MNEIKINIDNPQNGFLYLSDSYHEGWKAFSSDGPLPVFSANGLFKAVKINDRMSEVVFRFEPTIILGVVKVFLFTSTFSLLVFLTLVLSNFWSRNKRHALSHAR